VRLYLLSILCLLLAILVFQPRQEGCCAGLQQWLRASPTSQTARAPLQLPQSNPNNNTENTASTNTGEGYVFSLPLGQSELKSALPDKAAEGTDNNETLEQPIENPNNTIINTTEDLNILTNQPYGLEIKGLDSTTAQNQDSQNLQSQGLETNTSTPRNMFTRTNLITAFLLLVASFLQGASGFAFALLLIPLLVGNGFGLPEASMFTAVTALFIISLMVFRSKNQLDNVEWNVLWPTMFLRTGTMVVGIFLLAILALLDRAFVFQILGILLLTIVSIKVITRRNTTQDSKDSSPNWKWLAFASDGLLVGLAGFSGPAIASWSTTQNWNKNTSSAFASVAYLSILPIQILLLLYTFGSPTAQAGIKALYFLPIAVVGVFLGIWLSNKWNKIQITYVVLAVLLLLGIASILAPVLGLV